MEVTLNYFFRNIYQQSVQIWISHGDRNKTT